MTTMPPWEGFCIPVLKILSDGEVRTLRQLRREVEDLVGLSVEQRGEVLGSGQSRSDNRIGWATHFLYRVGAAHRPSRGNYTVTELGRELLEKYPDGVTENQLKAYANPDDQWWIQQPPADADETISEEGESPTLDPTEQVDQGITRIHREVSADLLSRLIEQDPAFFENAVVKLLLAMGYGGIGGRGATTALTNDGGIDGIIDQDVLGLSKVYVQAKRYSPGNTVQRPEVQGFVGALSGKADAGVFITTSRFSSGAIEWVSTVPARIILIDGQRLTELMIEYGVGVQVERTYRIVEIDEDFFT